MSKKPNSSFGLRASGRIIDINLFIILHKPINHWVHVRCCLYSKTQCLIIMEIGVNENKHYCIEILQAKESFLKHPIIYAIHILSFWLVIFFWFCMNTLRIKNLSKPGTTKLSANFHQIKEVLKRTYVSSLLFLKICCFCMSEKQFR